MTRFVTISAVLLAGCSFKPGALGEPSADASITADAGEVDGAVVDGGGPDGPPDPCVVASRPLELSDEASGSLAGPSVYDPTCSVAATGPADIYRLDVGATGMSDLVVQVTPRTNLDAVLDITRTCEGAPGPGVCGDSGGPGAPEVAVIPFPVPPGLRYIAVDAAGGSQGPYELIAFLRTVVSAGTICSPDLLASRCPLAHHCLDLDDDDGDEEPRCEERSSVIDVGANDDACVTPTSFDDDGVYGGIIDDAEDVDVVELAHPETMGVRVAISSDGGNCPADLRLELLSGLTCSTTSVVASDDNGGLGPCPLLTVPSLAAQDRVWLRVGVAPGARVGAGTAYSMVIDFIPPP